PSSLNSYEKYRANDDDVDVFAMFGSQMGYDSVDHDLHQKILNKYSNVYFTDQPQTLNHKSFQKDSVTNGRNKSQHVPADVAHTLNIMDYDDLIVLDTLEIPRKSRKKRQSNIPPHTFPFTD
ncbi:unnamed protein product, partial [Meganyctiphanes norvegica]